MGKRGGTKKDLYGVISRQQEDLNNLRNQRTILLIAARLALQQPTHDKNCWSLQKNHPGPCTCYVADLDNAVKKVEG